MADVKHSVRRSEGRIEEIVEIGPDQNSIKQPRIVIITNGNFFARIILDELIRAHHQDILGIVIVHGDYKGRVGLKEFFELAKVTAWSYLFFKVISVVFFKLAQIRYPQKAFGVNTLAKRYQIPVTRTASIKKDEIVTWISSLKADLIVSVSCPQMIGKKILSSAVLGGINIHSSLLPKFAGLAPYYWVLAENEKETGITAHYMTLKFDQGNILTQSKVTISEHESAFHLFCRLSTVGAPIIHQAVEMALANNSGYKQDLSGYSYFSNPSLKSYRQLKRNGFALFRFSELIESIKLVD